jgi:hypothetical protein
MDEAERGRFLSEMLKMRLLTLNSLILPTEVVSVKC